MRSVSRRFEYPGTGQIIGGPSWDQVRDGALVTLKRLLNPDCITYENKNEHVIELWNGSWFMLRSLADPDVLRGIEAHDGWIDEIAMCAEKALDIMLGRVRLPYHDPKFVHSVWGTTTPRGMDWTLEAFGMEGKRNWYDVTDAAGTKTGERVLVDYAVVHSTIFDNRANLPRGYIEKLQEKYAGTPFYDQELLGLYTAFEGLVYAMFSRDRHVAGDPCSLAECRTLAVGVDFGGGTPTALELLGQRTSGRIHAYDEMYRVGATLPDIIERLTAWEQRAGRKIDHVACDGSEPVAIATLKARGFNAYAANKDRDTGIKRVQQLLQPAAGGPGLTFNAECAGVLNEFPMYVWTSKKDAQTKVERLTDEPIDHHADGLDAVRYGVMALGTAKPPARVTELAGGLRVRGRRRAR